MLNVSKAEKGPWQISASVKGLVCDESNGPLLPQQVQFPVVDGAVPQIEVNKRLIGDPCGFGLCFEVVDCAAIDFDCNLPFQLFCIGVLSGVGKIVFGTQHAHLNFRRISILFLWLSAQK